MTVRVDAFGNPVFQAVDPEQVERIDRAICQVRRCRNVSQIVDVLLTVIDSPHLAGEVRRLRMRKPSME